MTEKLKSGTQLDVHERIECAETLASRFYVDPAVLELEKGRIFRRTWQLVGTLEQGGVTDHAVIEQRFVTCIGCHVEERFVGEIHTDGA